ncbi:UNVERIFIED_CONTAM: hypothetical protein NCL1_07589 [Trichonephila clavipes]
MDWGMPDLRVRGFAGVRSGELCFEERGSQEAGQTTQVGSREGGSTRGRKDRRCDDHLRNGECILVFHTKDLERRYHKDPTANLSPSMALKSVLIFLLWQPEISILIPGDFTPKFEQYNLLQLFYN